MKKTPKYFIVEATALPEVFLKVAEAKRLIATGQAATVNEATKMTGISRSAFYKYRDAVQPFQKMNVSRVITFSLCSMMSRACCQRSCPAMPSTGPIF